MLKLKQRVTEVREGRRGERRNWTCVCLRLAQHQGSSESESIWMAVEPNAAIILEVYVSHADNDFTVC